MKGPAVGAVVRAWEGVLVELPFAERELTAAGRLKSAYVVRFVLAVALVTARDDGALDELYVTSTTDGELGSTILARGTTLRLRTIAVAVTVVMDVCVGVPKAFTWVAVVGILDSAGAASVVTGVCVEGCALPIGPGIRYTLRIMDKAHLKEKEERRLLRGHLWAYRNEFARLPQASDGEVVDVIASNGRHIGRGFFQSEGGIAVRLLTRKAEEIDSKLLIHRIHQARRYRERIHPGSTVYRWVHGESDRLPGLVADRYGAVVSVQTSCAFYGKWLDALAEGFMGESGVEGVRFDISGQVTEAGTVPEEIEVDVDGLRLGLSLGKGQKTGMFLDQRENWRAMAPYAAGARVLDGFCYMGAWSCQAALAGAASVLGVDSSARAVEGARENARRNGVEDRCRFETGDVSQVLRRGEKYDLIFLDPPALAKTRAQTERALGLYQALNRDAMLSLEPGGYLVTSSCSHFVDEDAFLKMLKRAARAAQRDAWVVEKRGAGRDHPVLMSMPETAYLKNVTLRVF